MGLPLKAESWTWYGFVALVVLFRFASRWMSLGGFKKLQIEDWLMGFVLIIYTILIVFMNIVAFENTNLMTPEDIPNLTPEDISERVYGSKLVLLVEQCMITVQWGCKICLLLLYSKLTFGLNQQIAVKIVAVYVVCTWIVMEVLYFGYWCRPFHDYWAVPTPNIQCSAAIHHLIMNACFNISSDLMMLCIALPLLITSHLPIKRKLILCILFSLGCFTILCAALNKYYSFTQPFSPIWTFWYIREASTAILVANMPNCWPLFRKVFGLRSFNGSGDRSRSLADSSSAGDQGILSSITGLSRRRGSFSQGGGRRLESLEEGEEQLWGSRRERFERDRKRPVLDIDVDLDRIGDSEFSSAVELGEGMGIAMGGSRDALPKPTSVSQERMTGTTITTIETNNKTLVPAPRSPSPSLHQDSEPRRSSDTENSTSTTRSTTSSTSHPASISPSLTGRAVSIADSDSHSHSASHQAPHHPPLPHPLKLTLPSPPPLAHHNSSKSPKSPTSPTTPHLPLQIYQERSISISSEVDPTRRLRPRGKEHYYDGVTADGQGNLKWEGFEATTTVSSAGPSSPVAEVGDPLGGLGKPLGLGSLGRGIGSGRGRSSG